MRSTNIFHLNWKLLLPALLLAGGLALFSSYKVAHAQTDCVDPATGAACTPVPPPSCGVAGAPPCEPPPSQPEPTNTPRPRPTRTPTPTATFTATPTATAAATATSMATYTAQSITTATTAPVNAPAPNIPKPNLVTPKSQKNPWSPIVNWFTNLVNRLFLGTDDLLWLTKVNVVDAGGYYCLGGPMCPSLQVPWGNAVKVLIMPEGLVAPTVTNGQEQDFYPVLCQGKTGQNGCSEFVSGHRPGPVAQWSLNNYFFNPYGKSLPGVYEFDIPASWIKGAGTYTFTAYINYNQQAFSEDFSNNFITFQFTVTGDPSVYMAPSQIIMPDNIYYFHPAPFVALQGENCVLGCALTTNGAVNAGLPVEVFTRALGNPVKINGGLVSYGYISDPIQAAMFACKGTSSQSGCANPFAADAPPYSIPQWFLDGPDAHLLKDTFVPLVRFTIPGDQISKSGVYKFTFYVNYLQQASTEKNLSDNARSIYLQVFP